MDECFLYRNPPFSFPYAGLFNPLRNFHDNQFAITGPDGEGKRGKEEERKRREKKRLSQILYSDNRRQRLNERLRAKLENRKTKDEKFETQQENNILSEEDLLTLFDSEDKPKKRKRKKRKNKKKKKGENKDEDCKAEEAEGSRGAGAGASESCSPREALNESLESVVSELSEVDDLLSESFAKSPVEDKDVISVFVLEKDAENQADVEVEEVALSSDEDLICVAGAMVAREEAEEKVEESLEEISRIAEAGEESGKCENISCGDSTSSTERSTSEHDEKEAGETVSDDGEHENLENEEDRSTISPEERGNLSEMILDDEFPWHLYHTDDNSYSPTSFDDTSFTVVKRKEKRQRKRKPSPPRKKKRKPPRRRESRRQKDKNKEKQSPTIKRKNTIKNSPRTACPIRPVVIPISPKTERKPAAMQENMKGDPTAASPTSPPPGFEAKTPTCPEGVPSLTKPFEQFQAVNALFMKMPRGSIITIPFMPIDGVVDLLPMNLDLSYPLDCTYYVIPSEAPIDYVQPHC